jgi:hypothetical protein
MPFSNTANQSSTWKQAEKVKVAVPASPRIKPQKNSLQQFRSIMIFSIEALSMMSQQY